MFRSTCLLIATIALAVPADAAARIYKTVDEDGNIVFTDVPPKDRAEPVELGPGNRYTPPTPPAATATTGRDQAEEAPAPDAVTYDVLRIEAPGPDEAVRANAGNLTVQYTLEPALTGGHRVELMLDGKPVATSAGGPIALENVDRGTHTIVLQVADEAGEVHIASAPVTFHLLRHSVLQNKNRRPPPPPPPRSG